MSSIDQQFVEYIVKSLVGNPDSVQVERTIDEKGVLLELTVDPNDLGRVIGKRGATAQSLRTLLRALGTKNDARYNLKIVDNSDGPPRRDERRSDDSPSASKNDTSKPADDNDDVAADEAAVEELIGDEPEESSVASRTRKELADLDDLDV
jgi:uncharacterized protein